MLAKNYATALETLDVALRIDAEYATAHDVRGRVLYLAGRRGEAIAAMRQAIALDPRSGKMRLALAVMHEQMGETETAKQVLRELLAREPRNAQARQRLETLEAAGS